MQTRKSHLRIVENVGLPRYSSSGWTAGGGKDPESRISIVKNSRAPSARISSAETSALFRNGSCLWSGETYEQSRLDSRRLLDEAERTSAILIDRSATNLEKAEIYHMQSVQSATSSELDKSIDAGLKGLSLLGLTLPKQPADSMIGEEMARAETNLGSRQVADLLQAPMIKEAREAMIMVLLPDVTHAAYVTGNKNLLLISVLKAVNVSLRHGTVSASAFVFNMYGFFLGTFFGDFATGYEFGKVAIALNERFNDMSRKASTLFTYVTFVHSWNNHPRTYAEYYKRVIEAGLESGDLIFLAYSCINILSWDPEIDLPTAVEEGSRYLENHRGYKLSKCR